MNASSDDFTITLRAHGGHAGYPHTTGDPVVAAAEVVVGLQAVVARQVDPLRPAVITIGSLRSGDAPNVIPDTATVVGTVRAFDADDRSHLLGRVRLLAAQAAERHSCQVSVEHEPGEPPLANDPALASLVDRWIGSTVGLTGVDLRSCGSDDFSYYGTACPSAMVFYGVGDGGAASPGLHHPEFAPPDSDIEGVARCLLAGYLAGCALMGSSGVGMD